MVYEEVKPRSVEPHAHTGNRYAQCLRRLSLTKVTVLFDSTGSRSGALVRPLLLRAVAAGLTITCLLLLSVVIALAVHRESSCDLLCVFVCGQFSTGVTLSYLSTAVNVIISEQMRTQSNLTEQIKRLQEVQVRLEGEVVELSGERDRLNWTLGVILEHQNFPVAYRCPNRGEQDWQTDTLHTQLYTQDLNYKIGGRGLQGLCQGKTWCDSFNTFSQTGGFTGYARQKYCIVKLCFLILA